MVSFLRTMLERAILKKKHKKLKKQRTAKKSEMLLAKLEDKESDYESEPEPDSQEPLNMLEDFVSKLDVNHYAPHLQPLVRRMELRLQWPCTIRAMYGSEFGDEREFKIHGLFHYPYKLKDSPGPSEDADEVLIEDENEDVAGKELSPKILKKNALKMLLWKYWPSYKPNRNTLAFLKYEWKRHGRVTGLTQYQYFGLALYYFHMLKTGLKFKTNMEYSVGDFVLKLERHADRHLKSCNPRLFCLDSKKVRCMSEVTSVLLLKEISMCIKREGGEMVLTKSSNNDNWKNTNGRRGMIIPFKYLGWREGSETETDTEMEY